MLRLIIVTSFCLFVSLQIASAERPIKGTFKRMPAAGSILLAVAETGESTSTEISKKRFKISPPSRQARLYILKDGRVTGQLVVARCKQGRDARALRCNSKSKLSVFTLFKAGKNIGALVPSGAAYVGKTKSLAAVVRSVKTEAINFVPIGLGSNGLVSGSNSARLRSVDAFADSPGDRDGDGLVDAVDVDDDGDGIIDNYDESSGVPVASSFKIFSNLKLSMQDSLNLHATGLTTTAIDSALRSNQTLAIQVVGSDDETTELDCSTLSYCSAGGTGGIPPNGSEDFPGAPGGTYDPDGDGLGTITRGGTGDFQLKTGAGLSDIQGGDTLLQKVTAADGSQREVPGTLNFVFMSSPAIQSIGINSDAPQTIDYSSPTRLGAMNNCIQAPASGNVSLTITGWRPQRLGVPEAGEGTYIDIGRSKITIDIPNAPSVPPSMGGSGPGNCSSIHYSESDANLELGSNGLQDIKGDVDAASDNTYTFTVDITGCLGGMSWNSGEMLQVDLQFRSQDGDNAAQKFCVIRN